MIQLNDGQAAMAAKLRDFLDDPAARVFVLEGYAGTGKTTALASVLKDRDVIWLAPSHAAKYVLQDTLVGLGCVRPVVSTVSSALGERMVSRTLKTARGAWLESCAFRHQANEHGGLSHLRQFGDIIVVDEASMVQSAQCLELERRAWDEPLVALQLGEGAIDLCPCHTAKIIYVGDPYQLKPVVSSAPVEGIMSAEQERLIELGRSRVKRSRFWACDELELDDDFDESCVFARHHVDARVTQVMRAQNAGLLKLGLEALRGAQAGQPMHQGRVLELCQQDGLTALHSHDELLRQTAQAFIDGVDAVLLVYRNVVKSGALKTIRWRVLQDARPELTDEQLEHIVSHQLPHRGEYMVFNAPYLKNPVGGFIFTNGLVVKVTSEAFAEYLELPAIEGVGAQTLLATCFDVASKEVGARIKVLNDRESKQLLNEYRQLLYTLRDELKGKQTTTPNPALADRITRVDDALAATRELFADIDFAYVRTVHKAQGGTWDQVFVDYADITRCRDRGDRARLEYVAMTRAKTRLTLATQGGV